jgi:hypothetical protein
MADEHPFDALLRAILRRPRTFEDFRHVAKIADDRALLMEAAMQQKQKEINDAKQLVKTLEAELAGLHGRLFVRLHEVYPEVPREHGEVVRHKGDLYYVGVSEDE